MTKLKAITKQYLKREIARLEERYRQSQYSSEKVSLEGSMLTVKKLLAVLGEI